MLISLKGDEECVGLSMKSLRLQSSSEKVSSRQVVGPEQSCPLEESHIRETGSVPVLPYCVKLPPGSNPGVGSLGLNAKADPRGSALRADSKLHCSQQVKFPLKGILSKCCLHASLILQNVGP